MVYAQSRIRLVNDTQKILCDFDKQRDHLISARQDLMIDNNDNK